MKGRIALTTGAAAVFLASFCLGLADVRAGGDDDDKKIEKKIVVRSGSGRLGVTIGDTTGESRGATVRSVAEDSAAEKAGIKEGDVIVRFDGESGAQREPALRGSCPRRPPAARSRSR